MKLVCIHCGHAFVIRADQLGMRGSCPHCHGEIQLPRSTDPTAQRHPLNPYGWFDHMISGLVSMIFHMTVFLLLVYFQSAGSPTIGPGEEVQIGVLPETLLASSPAENLQLENVETASPTAASETLEAEAPVFTTTETAPDAELALATPSLGGTDAAGFDLGTVGVGAAGGMGGGGSWDGMLRTLRRHGLEIVIVFDSTGSMSGEIDTVKDQIRRIGTTLFTLIPKTRISMCTYRDTGDSYQVRGEPLTGDLQKLESFLKTVEAGGGGDEPEAVDLGLAWAVKNNKFRPAARKVILVFGDAPPHAENQAMCQNIAKEFRQQQSGIVSTVTCRRNAPLPEFYAIADAGGGEAFLSEAERQIMNKLIVLVFGSQHKAKVEEAFKLLEKK